jgi:beta-lactamase superfamily II metal-dependent hydrolase
MSRIRANKPGDIAAILRFFYCGRGDTILVEAGNCCGLIDCNLTPSSHADSRIRDYLDDRGIGVLDFVCLTHPDQDHYFGMKELLEERFWDPKQKVPRFNQYWDSGTDFQGLQALADRQRGEKRKAIAKRFRDLNRFICRLINRDVIKYTVLGEGTPAAEQFGNFSFIALGPSSNRVRHFMGQKWRKFLQSTDDLLQGPCEETNNLSTVLVMMHNERPLNILFGGDATTEVWAEAIEVWKKLHERKRFKGRKPFFSGVKVSHHGARGSLHPELYRDHCQGEETIAILSVGPGDPHHPHEDVKQMLRGHGIRAYATCWPMGVESTADVDTHGWLPLPGELMGTGTDGPAGETSGNLDDYPRLLGHRCADVEITVYADGRIEANPQESLL